MKDVPIVEFTMERSSVTKGKRRIKRGWKPMDDSIGGFVFQPTLWERILNFFKLY